AEAGRRPQLVVVSGVALDRDDRHAQPVGSILRARQVTRLIGRLMTGSGVGWIAQRLPVATPGIVTGGGELRAALEVALRPPIVDGPPDVLQARVHEAEERAELLTLWRRGREGAVAGDRSARERVRVRETRGIGLELREPGNGPAVRIVGHLGNVEGLILSIVQL